MDDTYRNAAIKAISDYIRDAGTLVDLAKTYADLKSHIDAELQTGVEEFEECIAEEARQAALEENE